MRRTWYCPGVAIRSRRRARIARRRNFQLLAQRVFQLLPNVRVFLQKNTRILSALSHAFATEADPRSALLEQAPVHAQVNQIAFARNPFAIQNVELRFAE